MAYLDLNNYQIWALSNIDGFHDDHVEIDEVIAPIISELNRKGYKTKFCCSGHPYFSLCEVLVTSEESAKGIVGLVETEESGDPDFPIRAFHLIRDDDFYILFSECSSMDFSIPLPEGFRWFDEKTIRYAYSKTDVYDFFLERLEASKALYEWVVKLPSYTLPNI